mmetsp:Transcript_75857/g.198953  ORF Transcript_75857/g.198953 Transcript_75857/m.198953 type:complete len:394 (+) Transcript_75857:505-1686(+)
MSSARLRKLISFSSSSFCLQQEVFGIMPCTMVSRILPKSRSWSQARLLPAVGDSACACRQRVSVSSTTSPTTTEVSSSLPPTPMGHSARAPLGARRVFACAAMTMHCARCASTCPDAGARRPASRAALQRSTSSPTKRLSKTPLVPETRTSPSFTSTQVTMLPRSMTSTWTASSYIGSMRRSTRVTRRLALWLSLSRRLPLWLMTSRGRPGASPRRSTSSSQSPTETTLTIGHGLPRTWPLLSIRAIITAAEPWHGVFSKASLSSGTGPLYDALTSPFSPGRSWSEASAPHAWSRARGSLEASRPNSSRRDTPSATPRHMEAARVASASFWRLRIFSGWGFWQLLALKQRARRTSGDRSRRRSLLGERLRAWLPPGGNTLWLAWRLTGMATRS